MRIEFSIGRLLILTVALNIFVFSGNNLASDEACKYCGMKRAKFEHSWIVIRHEDGTESSVCSVHCAAIDMALHSELPIAKISVGDYDTKRQIDAERAYWVIGGDKMGVMTARAKWAFETKPTADNFMQKHGGRPATFEEVMRTAFEDMYEDTLILQKKSRLMKNRPTNNQD